MNENARHFSGFWEFSQLGVGSDWGAFEYILTSPFAGRDGGTLVLDVQSACRVEDRVDENVRFALLQQVQHLLQGRGVAMWSGEELRRLINSD